MHLGPEDIDKLILHNAGFLAQKRLARGLRLNLPESIALIATQMLEFIRDGRTVGEILDISKQLLGYNNVMEGVPAMIGEVRVEGTFPDGLKTVVARRPIVEENGNLMLALYGSFLPVPSTENLEGTEFGAPPCTLDGGIGEIIPGQGEVELNTGRTSVELSVGNRGERPIHVGSHFHFMEVNRALIFDRTKAYGMRLDIPAGTTLRFEPGATRLVKLVEIGGNKVIDGGNALARGAVLDINKEAALNALESMRFSASKEANLSVLKPVPPKRKE